MHGEGTSKNRSDVWPGSKVTDCDGTATMGYVQLPRLTVKDPVRVPVFLTSTTAVEGLLSAAMATHTIRSELHNSVEDICNTSAQFIRYIRTCLHSVATLRMASHATHQAVPASQGACIPRMQAEPSSEPHENRVRAAMQYPCICAVVCSITEKLAQEEECCRSNQHTPPQAGIVQ